MTDNEKKQLEQFILEHQQETKEILDAIQVISENQTKLELIISVIEKLKERGSMADLIVAEIFEGFIEAAKNFDKIIESNRPDDSSDNEAKPEEKNIKRVRSIHAKNHVSPKPKLADVIFGCDDDYSAKDLIKKTDLKPLDFDSDDDWEINSSFTPDNFLKSVPDLTKIPITSKIYVAASLNFEDLPERLQKKFADRFTRAVHDTACSLILAGNKWIWGQQVIAAMGGYERGRQPTEALIRQVEDELIYMAKAWCDIDASCEARLKGYNFNPDEITLHKPLIPTAGYWEIVFAHGQRVKALKVVSEPALITYAKQTKQVISIPDMSLLALPETMSMTRETIILQRYLLERIEGMKNKKANMSRIIKFETVYKVLGMQEASRVEKKRIRDNVKKFLSDWQAKAYIKGYHEEKKGRLIYSVFIELYEDESKSKSLVPITY